MSELAQCLNAGNGRVRQNDFLQQLAVSHRRNILYPRVSENQYLKANQALDSRQVLDSGMAKYERP
jgi:fido (protein-threonine AMPylation protein)